MPEPIAATDATLVFETLSNFAQCAKLFTDAADEQRIQLADDMVPTTLLLIARHFERAAKSSREQRFDHLRALAGPELRERCEKVIDEATHSTRALRGQQFVAWLECEGI